MSIPIQPLRPNTIMVDEKGVLTREGYEFLKNIQILLNQVRAAMIAAGFPP